MRIHFMGGNGHSAARLVAARAVAPFEIDDVAYPGFEHRPRAPSLEAFLDEVAPQVDGNDPVYATGIGALLALCLRARGELMSNRLILQGGVLWGLERSLLGKLMRVPPVRALGTWWLRRRPGYRECAQCGDFFRWCTPSLLRRLEPQLKDQAVARVEAWWGGKDRVVSVRELQLTQQRLGTSWPLRLFPRWGHTPMVEDPEGWCDVVLKSIEIG